MTFSVVNTVGYQNGRLELMAGLPIKGIYYIGQYGTCGYACAAKGYLYHYFSLGVPITWHPLYFEDDVSLSKDDPYNVVVSALINKRIPEYDVVIMHSTPDLWPDFRRDLAEKINGKIVIGYCTWETNKLPSLWVECINKSVNEVWVPSRYNKEAFKASGVTIPIRVVPHIFLNQPLPARERIRLVGNEEIVLRKDLFTFYTIGEMNMRKSIEDLIHVFCKTFTRNDPVRLVVKTHYKDYYKKNKKKCTEAIKAILLEYPHHPEVVGVVENLKGFEILGLHSIGDCYVSLTKSEGFGLTIFDAFNYGKKVIATGYGGHMDFLTKDYPGIVNYTLGPVKGMTTFSENYSDDQVWAYPDLEHAGQLMKKVFDERTPKNITA